jgi:threonine/homoserine/homoserine lactone efflux protein
MPGPVLAATVAHSRHSRFAGAFIALGHSTVEIPLILLIYLGLSNYFQNSLLRVLIGFIGGVVLMYFGKDVFSLGRTRHTSQTRIYTHQTASLQRSTVSGAITSMANPYFLVWWMTVGAALVLRSSAFGLLGVTLFAIVHLSCDLVWYIVVSLGVHHSGRVWGNKVQSLLMGISSVLLFGFGVWFVVSSLRWTLEWLL